MRHYRTFMLAFAAFSLLVIASPHYAQAADAKAATDNGSGRLVIVDVEQLLTVSDAAKDIQKQLQAEKEKIQTKLGKLDDKLQSEKKDLIDQQKSLSEKDFAKKRAAFEQEVMDARQQAGTDSQNLTAAANDAVEKLRGEIVKVVAKMAKDKDFALVLTKQNVLLAEKSMDITDDVMKRLNSDVKTIKVVMPKPAAAK